MNGYRPDRDTYVALAADHVLVPVVREVLADVSTPVSVYDRLRGPGTFLLESVEHGERWGRYSFTGLNPLISLRARHGQVAVTGPVPDAVATAADTGDPLATIEALLESLTVPELDDMPPLFAGLVGYLGWDIVRHIEDLPDDTLDDQGLDDVRMMLPGQVVAFDHLRQRLVVVTNTIPGDDPGADWDRAVADTEALVARLAEPITAPVIPPPQPSRVDRADANMTPEAYMASVEACKAYIRAGDAFQVVPSQRFSLDTDVDPLAVHRVLRVINPSPYMYLFDYGDLQIVGSSPEALVTARKGVAEIWPIAGSQPRGETEAEDAAYEATLRGDEKERAEHVMLVDLARNDLGRISRTGSVRVDDFMSVVRYSHIMHLVSRVQARVNEGMGAVDVIRATFPAGTLSGAPKVRAMEIIDEVEPTRRGIYGGGIGYVDLAGNVDLCIAIRTLVFHSGRAHVQAGAGVVADSVPEKEYEETRNKAMALLSAVRAAEAWTAG
ncbi:anthranilate synthase component I [Euzebya rosea]|uniref:anthranilate synthase component I n=1 Tax=Euzebya rosea TaxID=2052804 RepID=UPI000D3E89A6|nr:anthranilate synthase component I [Euzebya rosea]